ncbi:MAG: hypothetical protein IKU21_05765 [Anaerotignum sp.]|jgi:hypothetical protein|nr:hypothetical protein [Anaerotignum sp.]
MSLGYGGTCRRIAEDSQWVSYEYAVYNLNVLEYEGKKELFDGEIEIRKSALIEPEIRETIKRFPGGRRKRMTKRIIREVPIVELLEKGEIRITECSHSWQWMDFGCEYIAYRLVNKIFQYYQENDILPEVESCHF